MNGDKIGTEKKDREGEAGLRRERQGSGGKTAEREKNAKDMQ